MFFAKWQPTHRLPYVNEKQSAEVAEVPQINMVFVKDYLLIVEVRRNFIGIWKPCRVIKSVHKPVFVGEDGFGGNSFKHIPKPDTPIEKFEYTDVYPSSLKYWEASHITLVALEPITARFSIRKIL